MARAGANGKLSPEYKKAISSAAWKKMRRSMIEKANFTCQRCQGVLPDYKAFEIHHLTYERLGHERPEDLMVLCKPCHEVEDGVRERRTQARREANAYYAGLDTYATKRWGEDWMSNVGEDVASEVFDEWVSKKEDQGLRL